MKIKQISIFKLMTVALFFLIGVTINQTYSSLPKMNEGLELGSRPSFVQPKSLEVRIEKGFTRVDHGDLKQVENEEISKFRLRVFDISVGIRIQPETEVLYVKNALGSAKDFGS